MAVTTDSGDKTVAATEKDVKGFQHTAGGVTTRDDANDLGVPMLPGDPSEPTGPEDALGEGPTRGDYRQRLGYYHVGVPHEALPAEDAKDGEPQVQLVPQGPRLEEIGEVPGKKGGVNSKS